MTNEDFFRFQSNIEKLLKIKPRSYNKRDNITIFIEKREQICLLIQGEVNLIRFDSGGEKIIVDKFLAGQLFGEFFHSVTNNNELIVVANSECSILSFSYYDLLDDNVPKGQAYYEVMGFLLFNFKRKIIAANERIEILTKRSIREKLLSYFEMLCYKKNKKTIVIKSSYSDLADFLIIDRAAMMRELKNLVDEGFIARNKKTITLLYD